MGTFRKISAIAILVLLLAGCTRNVYVPQKETEYRDRVQYDSVIEHDSVVVFAAGDTVYIYKDRWRDRVHIQRDTVAVHDSIPYPVEVVRTVKHIPTVYRWSLWIALAAIALIIKKVAFR